MKRIHFDWTVVLLVLILAAAFGVRVYGINFPLYHWDEGLSLNDAFYAVGNSMAMLSYEHGSLYTYILLLVWTPLVMALQRGLPGSFDFFLVFYQNPLLLEMTGRLVSVLASTGTVLAVYVLAQRLYSRTAGLIAAFFLALTFVHVAESHYMRVYALTALFSTLAIYYCIRIVDNHRIQDYFLGGLFVGLATATQYSVIVLIAPLLIAHVTTARREWGGSAWSHLLNKPLLIALDTAAVVFFLTTPYALIEFPMFAGHMKWFFLSFANHAWVSPEGQPVWLFYLTEHLTGGMGPGLEVVAIVGVLYTVYRHRARDLVLAAFPIVLFVSLNSGPNFARYVLPIVPLLLISASKLLCDLSDRFALQFRTWERQTALSVVACGLVIPSALNIVRFDFWLTQPDTRSLATEWIESNIPSDTKIVIEGGGFLGPTVPPSRTMLDAQIASGAPNDFGALSWRALRASLLDRSGYQVDIVARIDREYRGGILVGFIPSARIYADKGIDYLVTVNWMIRDENDSYTASFQESLDALYDRIAEFRPTHMFRYDPYAWRMDYAALAQVVPGQPEFGGPLLTIYRLHGSGE